MYTLITTAVLAHDNKHFCYLMEFYYNQLPRTLHDDGEEEKQYHVSIWAASEKQKKLLAVSK